MTGKHPSRTILLFGPGTAILPSLPITARPVRAANVKGSAAGALWRALPLTAASTLTALFVAASSSIVRHQEKRTMGLVTLVTTCGLAAKAALFVPLHGSPRCYSPAKIVHNHRNSRIVVWQPDIRAASRRFGVPARWIADVMRAESGGHLMLNGQPIRSSTGAMGLMQVMPQTYAALRARYDLGANPYAPRNNIMAGAAYLREMFDRFGAPWFLAAYNAGPARLEQTLLTGRALPAQTQRYLAAVAPKINASMAIPLTSESRSPVSIFSYQSTFSYQSATDLQTIPRPASSTDRGLFVAKVELIRWQGPFDRTP